jgi:hypothetical protein
MSRNEVAVLQPTAGVDSPGHPSKSATETLFDHTANLKDWLDQLFAEWDGTLPDVPRTDIAKLSDVLPEHKWWLAYIDPRDHADALALDPANPGRLYDSQWPPGFQQDMRAVLDDPAVIAARVDAAEYERMHGIATWTAKENHDPTAFNRTGTALEQVGFFTQTMEAAAYLADEILVRRPLVSAPRDMYMDDDEIGHVALSESRGGGGWTLEPAYNPDDMPALVNDAFARYYDEMDAATSDHDRLRAIVRVVRTSHVLHPFSDGNGRVGLYVLLPKLMANGLRPVILPSMAYLFNGGFTVDQMATGLRWALDQELPVEGGEEVVPEFTPEPEPVEPAADNEEFIASDTDRARFMISLAHFDSFADHAAAAQDAVANLDGIAEEDLVAVLAFACGDIYQDVNRALRTDDQATITRHDNHIRMLTSGLNQLPAFQGAVVRTIHVPADELDDVAARYTPGTVVQENAFTSSALDAQLHGGENVVFTIHSTTGRDISSLQNPSEVAEVVFTPGSRFKVVTRKFSADGGGMWLIGLIQQADRPSAPAPARTDYDSTTNAMVLADQHGLVDFLLGRSLDPATLGGVLADIVQVLAEAGRTPHAGFSTSSSSSCPRMLSTSSSSPRTCVMHFATSWTAHDEIDRLITRR